VGAHVRLQVRRLGVGLGAARVRARVDDRAPSREGPSSPHLRLLRVVGVRRWGEVGRRGYVCAGHGVRDWAVHDPRYVVDRV